MKHILILLALVFLLAGVKAQATAEREYQLGKEEYLVENYEPAFAWFGAAAEQGHAEAQYYVGRMFFRGQGVKQRNKQAAFWYKKAAEQGYARAQNNLGLLYYYGWGVEQSYPQAFAWYKKSADQGHSYAQRRLGEMYDDGKGVHRDYRKAAFWHKKAADQGLAQRNWFEKLIQY